MIPGYEAHLPKADYIRLAFDNGVGTAALTAPLSKIDFTAWKDAVELRKCAENITRNSKNPLLELLYAVNSKVKLNSKNRKRPPFRVMEIWESASGNYRDRMRLFFAFAKQLGYNPMLVGLLKRNGRPFHLLCELSKNGRTDTVDLKYNTIFSGKSVADIATENSPFPAWPKEIKKALKRKKVYIQPSEFIDYKSADRELANCLRSSGAKNIPVFGLDPQTQLRTYAAENKLSPKSSYFGYWEDPICALPDIRDIPQNWLVKYREKK